MFVLGTAGHIDHGKSTLVKALTGIDPDRLSEEKERGMTIDLGFAWLKLPSGREVGIVDVPGHERFIKNMLAGVGGIDLALLVIAANEGVMPQTREHLAILDLLEIKRGIVAITKKDLVDDEWLGLVKMDIEELLAGTTFAGAPIIAVSATTGEGLQQLIATIDEILTSIEPKKDIGKPRLPVDRIFTISGSGTIVTGTLIDGSLSEGQEMEIIPSGLKSRIRGLQTHKTKVTTATPGSRVAINLVGVATSQIERGDVLTIPGWLVPTRMATVHLRLLSYLNRPLAHNTEVSFHTGAAEAMAHVRLLDKDKLEPGDNGWAQLVLSKPLALVKGDHFIIRSTMDTLGGGKVVDLSNDRLRRFRPTIIQSLKVKEEGSVEDVILSIIETKQPVEITELLAETNLPSADIREVIGSLVHQSKVLTLGPAESILITQNGWESLMKEAEAILKDYHQRFPTRSGMQKAELVVRLKLGKYVAAIWQRLIDKGILIEEGPLVRLPAHQVRLTPAQQAKVDIFLRSLAQNPYSPPTDQMPEPEILNLLIGQHKVVKVSEGIVFSTQAHNEMVEKVTAYIKTNGKVTLGEVRDLFQTSRKYAQAFLEHLDEKKVTRRVGDERVLY